MEDFKAFPDLDLVLGLTSQRMKEMKLMSLFDYEFECGHILQQQEPILTRPSYRLNLKLNNLTIAMVHYELDTRFGLEINEDEIDRVENVLADRCVSMLAFNGVQSLVALARNNITPQSILRESDDKKNYGIN